MTDCATSVLSHVLGFCFWFVFCGPCTCLWCEVRFQAGMNLVRSHLTHQCCRRTDQVIMLKGWLCLIFYSPQAEAMMVSAAIRLCLGQDVGRTQSQWDHICLFARVLVVRVSSGVLSAAGMLVCRWRGMQKKNNQTPTTSQTKESICFLNLFSYFSACSCRQPPPAGVCQTWQVILVCVSRTRMLPGSTDS